MITRSIQAFGMGALAVASTMAGGAIDETTHVKLGSAIAVAGVIVPAAWWLSAKFTQIFDRLRQIDAIQEEMRKLREDVRELPCQTTAPDCDAHPQAKHHRK